jgi:phosphoribosylformylglycinamidine cyclo-ligase
MPPVMKLIQEQGGIEQEEMFRTFNCGIGMVIVVAPNDAAKVLKRLDKLGEKAYIIGEVSKKNKARNQVVIT